MQLLETALPEAKVLMPVHLLDCRASTGRRVVVIRSLPKVENLYCRQKGQYQRLCQAPADSQTNRLSNKCSGRKGDGSVRQ